MRMFGLDSVFSKTNTDRPRNLCPHSYPVSYPAKGPNTIGRAPVAVLVVKIKSILLVNGPKTERR